ncbi:hypothetical protein GCM10010911_23100 [Paenibacillus nasutitermitis]|uniref:Uncharacterized protein n=1 Tax=Paenibacillus nasutitermitis TaxID=1652958 RepID=A0A916YWL6_9BACL|nr:hypothetical protein GCM10010911_23100 [Paenibacillus nasutitermitis]
MEKHIREVITQNLSNAYEASFRLVEPIKVPPGTASQKLGTCLRSEFCARGEAYQGSNHTKLK